MTLKEEKFDTLKMLEDAFAKDDLVGNCDNDYWLYRYMVRYVILFQEKKNYWLLGRQRFDCFLRKNPALMTRLSQFIAFTGRLPKDWK